MHRVGDGFTYADGEGDLFSGTLRREGKHTFMELDGAGLDMLEDRLERMLARQLVIRAGAVDVEIHVDSIRIKVRDKRSKKGGPDQLQFALSLSFVAYDTFQARVDHFGPDGTRGKVSLKSKLEGFRR